MLKKMAVVGGIVAVAGLGLGGAAWAESDSAPATAALPVAAPLTASTSTVPATTASSPGKATKAGKAAKAGRGKHPRREALAKRLERVSHAQWVTRDGKTGAFVTHNAVRGTVSAVSAGSITVKATDGTSETFAVTSATKVHLKGGKRTTDRSATRAAATISQVKVGDRAGVLGTGAGPMTATQVIDRGAPKPAKPTTAQSTAPTTS